MTNAMLLIKERFGITDEQAEMLDKRGMYGIFIMPCFEKRGEEDEILLTHQLFKDFNQKSEEIVSEITEINKFRYVETGIEILSTTYTK